MDKQNVGWPSNEIVSIVNCYIHRQTLKTRSIKMRDTKGHTLYDSIYIKMSRLGKSTGEHHYWRTGTKRAR